jgi:hypothetical protein
MRAFEVSAGTRARILNNANPQGQDQIVTTRALYFEEDVTVDPLGKMGLGPVGPTIGAAYASAGWYGFKVPDDPRATLFVHARDLTIH